MPDDRFKALLNSELIASVRKKYGKNILSVADELRLRKLPRISTGAFFLNYALGGGFPWGRTSIVWGHKSTGKTVICLRTLGNAQKMCSSCYTVPDEETGKCECGNFTETVCAYIDPEGSWDRDWARLHGVNTERVLLSIPEYAEQTFDIAEALLRSGNIDFMVIDSIAFMTPAKEIEEKTSKVLPGEQARVMGRGVRKFVAAFNNLENTLGRRPTLLFTNQIRMKIGLLFGNPETQPGGHAAGFSATTEVKTFGGKYEMDEVTGRPMHVTMGFRVEKNKSFDAKIEGEWRLMLADSTLHKRGSVYEEEAMVNMGIKLGLVEKKGNGWTCLGENYRTKSLLSTTIASTPELKKKYGGILMEILTS